MREKYKAPVGDARQQRYLLLYIFIYTHTSLLLDVSVHFYLFSLAFISPISCSCLSLTVPSSRFPHQIFCSRTTAAPFLQSSPLIHTTDILAHCLASLNVHSKLLKSGPFLHRVPDHFSQATRPAAEHAFYCNDRLVLH